MARILANHIKLHGNDSIQKLENEIFIRLHKDAKKNGESRENIGIKKIFFGLDNNDEFDWEEKVGADWAYFQKQDGKSNIVFISPYYSVSKLQDHITLYASKLDPSVAVQLEYEDISGAVIGTRLTAYSESTGLKGFKVHKFTPSADNRELSRTAMGKIRTTQRNQVHKELIKQMGDSYKSLKLS